MHESLYAWKKDRKFSRIQSGLLWCDCELLKRVDDRMEAAAGYGRNALRIHTAIRGKKEDWENGIFLKEWLWNNRCLYLSSRVSMTSERWPWNLCRSGMDQLSGQQVSSQVHTMVNIIPLVLLCWRMIWLVQTGMSVHITPRLDYQTCIGFWIYISGW